jgi:hypothetical protein
MCVFVYVCMYACMHARVCVWGGGGPPGLPPRLRTHPQQGTRRVYVRDVRVYVRTYVCTYVCMYVCMCVYVSHVCVYERSSDGCSRPSLISTLRHSMSTPMCVCVYIYLCATPPACICACLCATSPACVRATVHVRPYCVQVESRGACEETVALSPSSVSSHDAEDPITDDLDMI